MATYVIQKGDNLTRIARQFKVGHWRHIYEHPKNAEFRRKRPNPNLVYPGDVLFIPGQSGPGQEFDFEDMDITGTDTKIDELPEKERKELLDDAKKKLPKDGKQIADRALEVVAIALTTAQVLELLRLISLGPWAMLGPLVLAARMVLSWASALEINEKAYGLHGVAYTTTAWAYGRQRPTESPHLMDVFRKTSSTETIQRRRVAWEKLSLLQWQYWDSEYRKKKVSKEALQAAIKLNGIAMATNNWTTDEQRLCLTVLQSFENDFRYGINRDNWKQGYHTLYPK